MVDVLTPEQRREVMSRIRGQNTGPERIIRSGLHRLGFRFRLQRRDLPGRPDLILPRYRAVVFVHGCFWHGHDCPMFRLPTTRNSYWWTKILGNRARDKRTLHELGRAGWRVMVVWECALRGRTRLPLEQVLGELSAWICSDRANGEITGRQEDG